MRIKAKAKWLANNLEAIIYLAFIFFECLVFNIMTFFIIAMLIHYQPWIGIVEYIRSGDSYLINDLDYLCYTLLMFYLFFIGFICMTLYPLSYMYSKFIDCICSSRCCRK